MNRAAGDMPPTLATARLLLRAPITTDFQEWVAFHADEKATRFLGGTLSRPLVWRIFCTNAGSWSMFGFGQFSVIEKATGRWVGRVGPFRPEGWPGPEVSWGLLSDYWGRGYATEAATAAMEYAFESLGWAEVIHCINPANVGSIRVAERLGSTRVGRARLPEPLDEEVGIWHQTRDEWRTGRRR